MSFKFVVWFELQGRSGVASECKCVDDQIIIQEERILVRFIIFSHLMRLLKWLAAMLVIVEATESSRNTKLFIHMEKYMGVKWTFEFLDSNYPGNIRCGSRLICTVKLWKVAPWWHRENPYQFQGTLFNFACFLTSPTRTVALQLSHG
jgi:hypothetical protein